jgi:hypothetical protein
MGRHCRRDGRVVVLLKRHDLRHVDMTRRTGLIPTQKPQAHGESLVC